MECRALYAEAFRCAKSVIVPQASELVARGGKKECA
jgi:hypothetical protein